MKIFRLSTVIAAFLILAAATGCEEEKTEFSIVPSLGFQTTEALVNSDDLQPLKVLFHSNTEISEVVNITVAVNNIGSVAYGQDYTTDPAPENGVITLTLDPEDEAPGFTVYPLPKAASQARKIHFEILSVSGNGLSLAQLPARTFTLTIAQVQLDPNQLTVKNVRDLYTGTTTTLAVNKFIEAVVISTNDNVTSKNVYVQDNTGGIVLRLNTSNLDAANKLALGDLIRVPLSGVTLTAFNKLLQLGDGTTTLPNSNIQKIGTRTLPAAKTITIAQLNSDAFQSQRVRIENITFPSANGTATVEAIRSSSNGNIAFTDGSASCVMRIESYAPDSFKNKILPSGTVTLTGIASMFNTGQLVPATADDIP